jgi:hypothetical protein
MDAAKAKKSILRMMDRLLTGNLLRDCNPEMVKNQSLFLGKGVKINPSGHAGGL